MPRTRNTDEGEWFTATYNGGQLGEKFAVLRGAWDKAQAFTDDGQYMDYVPTYVTQDREASRALLAARTQQREQLVTRYAPEPHKP